MTEEQKHIKIKWLHFALIALAVLVAYGKIFNAGFITWDDADYILNNEDIKNLGIAQVSAWFSSFYIGNYHPLTIFSYALDYMVGGEDPMIYHLVNVLLHIANAFLVYLITCRLVSNSIVSVFVALLFAIHPVQTESVSWVAERKNVLYGLFFLLSVLNYLRYTATAKSKFFWLTLVLGIAAMLSKAAAITLPLSLLAIDICQRRSLADKKTWLEKIPLFLCALVIGVVGIQAQEQGQFLNLHPEYDWLETIVFAGYAYTQYIVQLFVPAKLSVLYPYPQSLSVIHFIYLFISTCILALAVIAYRKKWFILCAGIVFYTVNIALVLQFVQFGEVLMADRYLYIPSIGIWLPFVYYGYHFIRQKAKTYAGTVGFSFITAVFLFLTYTRNDIWLSEMNFWQAIVRTFPNSSVAQSSLGGIYLNEGNYPEAIAHIDKAVQADAKNHKAWYNKGVVHLRQGNIDGSLSALNQSINLQSDAKALFTRALLYQQVGKPVLALTDIEKVLAEEPQNGRAYFIKASCMEQLNNLAGARENYGRAIQYQPAEPLFHMRRGIVNAASGRNSDAYTDLSKAIELAPQNAEAWYWRGMVSSSIGQDPCRDLNEAARRGFAKAREAIAQFCIAK